MGRYKESCLSKRDLILSPGVQVKQRLQAAESIPGPKSQETSTSRQQQAWDVTENTADAALEALPGNKDAGGLSQPQILLYTYQAATCFRSCSWTEGRFRRKFKFKCYSARE